MSHRVLFTSIFWTLLMTQGLKYSGALKGPCHEELYRLHFDEDAFKPLCTSRGFYEDKQCNPTNCWCVNQCGRAVPGTYGDYFITCEEQPAPCLKEYMASLSSNPVLGQFRPRCGSDGFYHHTQCFGATCFCYDKCGNKVPGSDHPLSHVRDMICACPNDDHAYNCATNPCESATCDYPSATCKPSICGGCRAEFTLGSRLVECGADRCIDDDGTQYQIKAEFERDCQQCYCEKWGEIMCYDKRCPSLERPPDGCNYVIPPGGCCATRVYCQQPTWECLFLDLPIALCDGNPCRFTPCEAYPDAICVVQFCGSKACTAVFQDEHRNELDCSAGKRIPGEILNLSTVIPTTLPTPTPCPPITCGNSCGSSGRKIINGCRTCECVDAPTTIPSCQPVTCTHFCGPSGLKIVNGCEICECAKPEEIISTTTPPTTTSPPCPLITCKNSCPFGRKVVGGCRTCECIDGSHSSISKPTAAPSECMDSDGRYHANGESWIPDPCMTCICENGDVKCFHQYCEVLPLYCEVDSVQDPQACCPRFTCPESCTDSLGNERSINEVYIEGCQTCTCMPSGKSRCTPIPCPPPVSNPPAGCRHVIPPGGCCPTRLACTESEKDCVGPVAQCLQNACLHEVCEVYPDAKCSISFCGLRACRAVFYDENDQEVDCKKAEIIRVADGDCYDESSGKTYKVGDEFTNECNDCTCMQDGQIVCSEKPCGCVEASSGKFYKIGDSYNNGCNQCICKEDGFMCSRKICKGEEN